MSLPLSIAVMGNPPRSFEVRALKWAGYMDARGRLVRHFSPTKWAQIMRAFERHLAQKKRAAKRRRNCPSMAVLELAPAVVGGLVGGMTGALAGRALRRRNPVTIPEKTHDGFRLTREDRAEIAELLSLLESGRLTPSSVKTMVAGLRNRRDDAAAIKVMLAEEAVHLFQSTRKLNPTTRAYRRNRSNDHDLPARRVPVPPIKLPRNLVKGTMPLSEALRRNIPGIREALASYRRFHGGRVEVDPEVIIIDDGRADLDSGFLIGRTPEVTYTDVPMGSNKQGSPWGHETRKSKPTYLAHSPRTNMTVVLGGMRVTDWLRG